MSVFRGFQPRRLLGVAVAGLLLAGVQAVPASARTPVDPETLTPAPPDFFNATCYRDGGHTTCDLAFSDDDIVDEPSGIVCDGAEMLYSQSRRVVGKRFYDGDGKLVQRHFREYLGGDITNPTNGKVVYWSQHDTVLHNLLTPGDVSSGTIRFNGLQSRVWEPGGGTILTDAGKVLVDAATDEVQARSAHHPFDDYFRLGDATALAPVCAALS